MNSKLLASLLFSLTVAAAGIVFKSYFLIVIGVAAAISLIAYFYYTKVQQKRAAKSKQNEQEEIKEKIKQVNFPVFMNNVKQKYGEIIFKYRLPPNPLTLEKMLYWCCDDFLVIVPEWNYYQELIYQKYKDSCLNETEEKKLFDDLCVINKRDILYFEKSRSYNRSSYSSHGKYKRYEREIPIYNEVKTCISYRKNGFMAEKLLPEAAFDILMQLIPEKAKSVPVFPGK